MFKVGAVSMLIVFSVSYGFTKWAFNDFVLEREVHKPTQQQQKIIEEFKGCISLPLYKEIFEQCVRNGGNHCQDDTLTIVCPRLPVG